MTTVIPNREEEGFDILNMVMARLWKPTPFSDPMLALEITQGEFKGIVFSFSKFQVMPMQMEGGFVPTKYETTIHVLPSNFPKGWEPNEAFDSFTSEVLFKWLSYIHTTDLVPLIKAHPGTSVH
jgi:hypothetical protein